VPDAVTAVTDPSTSDASAGPPPAFFQGALDGYRTTHRPCFAPVCESRLRRDAAAGAASLSGEEAEPADDRRQLAHAAAQPPPGYTPTRRHPR